jgi:hypothetical protein
MKLERVNRLARIETEARRLARSGKYRDFTSIQAALLKQGFGEASPKFWNRWTCSELDRLCEQAMREKQTLEVARARGGDHH